MIVKSSPRRKVNLLVDGVSPFLGNNNTSAESFTSSSDSSPSMGFVEGASQDKDTPNGVASRMLYSFTLNLGDNIAACMAQPFDVHSSAFKVVFNP